MFAHLHSAPGQREVWGGGGCGEGGGRWVVGNERRKNGDRFSISFISSVTEVDLLKNCLVSM